MILYVVLLLAILLAMFWLASFILHHVEVVTIIWGTWGSYKIESTNLLIALIVTFIALYFIIWLLKSLFAMKKNIQTYRHTRLATKAGQELTQGLMLFTFLQFTAPRKAVKADKGN